MFRINDISNFKNENQKFNYRLSPYNHHIKGFKKMIKNRLIKLKHTFKSLLGHPFEKTERFEK